MTDWGGVAITLIVVVVLGVFARRLLKSCGAANRCNWGNDWLNVMDGLNRIFCFRYHRMHTETIGLPERGAALVVANHVSGLDPLLLIAASRRPLRFMIAREEYERFGLRWLFRAVRCIPVERGQRPERALRTALRALREGEVVVIFPHGGIHNSDTPGPLKSGVVRLAQLARVPVYPVHIDGVRGRGQTLLALPRRGHVRLKMFAPLDCAAENEHQCMERLSCMLHKSLWGKHG